MIEYGYDISLKNVVGEKVLIEKLQKEDLNKIDGIYIPDSKKYQNSKIGVGKIIDITDDTAEKYMIHKGDYVLYDYYSAFGDWKEAVITNAENIIFQLTEKEAYDFLNGTLNV